MTLEAFGQSDQRSHRPQRVISRTEPFALKSWLLWLSSMQRPGRIRTSAGPTQNGSFRHTDTWLRWFHANSKEWRKKLERESSDDRDFILMFVRHWARAFIMDPQAYKERHPIAILE